MKYCLPVVLVLFLCGMVAAQEHSAHTQSKPATLMQGYGDLHHSVSTSNDQAQQFFDQGLRQITPSTTTRLHVRFSVRQILTPNWLWPTGA
jgi:hypothetical protein